MNRFIHLFLLLLPLLSFAQVTKITYRFEIPVDESVAADYYGEVKRRELKDVFKYTDFELVFDSKQSKYYSPAIMESDNIPFREAASYLDIDKPVYADSGYRYYYGSENMGVDETYLVKSPVYEWQLHKETKTIAGYKCYKATYTWPGFKGVGPTHTAWYCPDIKSRFGPMGMGNLPGAILQFQYGGYIHTATKVVLNVKEKVDFPIATKVITEEEYHIIWDEWEIREMGKTFRE